MRSASERLKVVFRRVRRESTADDQVLTVFCQREGQVTDLRSCRACEHCRGLSIDSTDRETFLRCTFADAAASPQAQGPAAFGQLAPETTVGDVMTSPVRCATRETSVQELTALFLSQGISAVPVVDAAGHAIGVVSKTDVLRRYYEAGDATGAPPAVASSEEAIAVDLGAGFRLDKLEVATVADVMTHVVFCLEASAPISRAAALMAYEGVHRLVVTAADRRAEGIVSSLDILRWIARQSGYVVPSSTRHQVDPEE